MKLRGIDFSRVHQASGATNFYGHEQNGPGHGWWYHHPLAFLGQSWKGTTIVTKTTTLEARTGNMPLKKDGVTPKEWLPRCIIVNREHQAVLNAVSLSGPGLEFLINSGEWQSITTPFFISVMSLAPKQADRLSELKAAFSRLAALKKFETFRAPWGIQVNLSCPNGGLDPNALVDEAMPILDLAQNILQDDIPLSLKFGPEVHPESMVHLTQHPRLDAIVAFNTMPFGKQVNWGRCEYGPRIPWTQVFGTDDPKESPLAKRFPGFAGGLSGAPLRPLLFEWLDLVRKFGVQTPIIAGGGLLSGGDALHAFALGASAVSFGSIAMLKPFGLSKAIAGASGVSVPKSEQRVTSRY